MTKAGKTHDRSGLVAAVTLLAVGGVCALVTSGRVWLRVFHAVGPSGEVSDVRVPGQGYAHAVDW